MTDTLRTYIFLNHKALCLVQQPMGKKDVHGNKIPRVAHQFSPNWEGKAVFKTSDPKVSVYIESTNLFKSGRIVAVESPVPDKEEADGSQDGIANPDTMGSNGRRKKAK